MNLYVLRHASAGTRRPNPLLDTRRPLDKEGKAHCLHLAHVIAGLKLHFDLVVSSPLKRSLQTAQMVATETAFENKLLISNALAPAAGFAQFQKLLAECRGYDNVLVVGHNPNLTQFLGYLIGGWPQTAITETNGEGRPQTGVVEPARVRLRKGSMAAVRMERGPASLQWLLHPRLVKALYATSTKSSLRKISRK